MNEKKVASNISYSDIQIGAVYTFERIFSEKDLAEFARLTGDFNPLHVDREFGAKSKFKQNIVHGMLAGSLFSTLVGMYCPGENSIYLSQTLKFKNPIFPGDKLIVKGTVMNKNDSIRIVTLKTEIFVKDVAVISGEAKVVVTWEKIR